MFGMNFLTSEAQYSSLFTYDTSSIGLGVRTAGSRGRARLRGPRGREEVGLAPAVLAVHLAEFRVRPHRHQHLTWTSDLSLDSLSLYWKTSTVGFLTSLLLTSASPFILSSYSPSKGCLKDIAISDKTAIVTIGYVILENCCVQILVYNKAYSIPFFWTCTSEQFARIVLKRLKRCKYTNGVIKFVIMTETVFFLNQWKCNFF